MRVWAPATSANLGPGFDSFGVAFDFGLTVSSTESDVNSITGGDGPPDETNLIFQAIRAVTPHAPTQAIAVEESFEASRGLGSSAAAIACGLLIGQSMSPTPLSTSELFTVGSEIEGHPDNLAAAMFGGFTIVLPDGQTIANQVANDVEASLWISDETSNTAAARAVLPESVSFKRLNAARAAALALVLSGATQPSPQLLLQATEDDTHQAARAHLYPLTTQLIAKLRALGVAACVSGAGPSVLAFTSDEPTRNAASTTDVQGFTRRNVTFSKHGATKLPLLCG